MKMFHYLYLQHTFEDYIRQLEAKDFLMTQMTAQLRAKDQQLTTLMDLLTDDTNKVHICIYLSFHDSALFQIVTLLPCHII